MEPTSGIENVYSFWNTEACDTHVVPDYSDLADFYEKFREHRYRTQWHLPVLVPFAKAAGKKILEIGTGNGADGAMFALHGGIYTGVDLTETALTATRKHFEVLGLSGNFLKQNSEKLSFEDQAFDWVYSHGVLHHTPHPERAIQEVYRVLKPGGSAIVMLYHKHSFNYWVRIMGYMRLRLLWTVLTRLGRLHQDRQALARTSLIGLRGNADRRVWEIHYQNFLRQGWSYLRAKNFIHHSTDGPECPIAYAFSRTEASRLFGQFREVTTKAAHFPITKYSIGRQIPFAVERFLAPKMGWYLFIYGVK